MFKKFFTLIELIVVIVVLGILAAIVIPNISNISEKARTAALDSDARNIETAVDMFVLKNNEQYPTEDKTGVLAKENRSEAEKTSLIEFVNEEGLLVEIDVEEVLVKDLVEKGFLRKAPKEKKAKFYLVEGGDVIWKLEGVVGNIPKPSENDDESNNSEEDNENNGSDSNPPENVGEGENTTPEEEPVEPELPANENIVEFKFDQNDAFYITTDGEVYGRGLNNLGRVGLGHTSKVNDWTKITFPAGVKIKDILLNTNNAYFITDQDLLYATGREVGIKDTSSSGVMPDMNRVINTPTLVSTLKLKEISQDHILYQNGDLYTVGGSLSRNSGVIGCNSCRGSYQKVESNVTDLIHSVWNNFSIIKKSDGKYYAAGEYYRNFYKYADNVTLESNTFKEIVAPELYSLESIKNVSGLSGDHRILLANGDVYDRTPQKLLTNIESIYGFHYASVFAIASNGDVYGLGDNYTGNLLLGHRNTVDSFVKIPALSQKNIVEFLVVSQEAVVYRTSNNKVYGYGVSSALNLNSSTPVEIDFSY